MPLPYTPYKLASASVNTPASLLGTTGYEDELTAVPTPHHPGLDDDDRVAGIPLHQAIDARLYFPSESTETSHNGFVLARTVAGGRELQLRWSVLSDELTKHPKSSSNAVSKASASSSFSSLVEPKIASEVPRSFLFPAPLLPSLGLFADRPSGRLYILAVTTTGFLYRLTFSLPSLFYQTDLPSGWATEYRIQHLASSESSLSSSVRGAANAAQAYCVDAGLVLVTCADGTIVKLSQNRSSRKGSYDGTWKENILRPTSFLSGVSRFFGRSAATSDIESSPSFALALDVFQGDDGTALAFAASRDRKLRVWNLVSDSCIRTIDLPLQMDSTGASENQLVVAEDEPSTENNSQETQAYFSTVSRPFIKVFVPGQEEQEGYSLYVMAYIPASPPCGNFFALYGIELEESKSSSGGLGEVTLLWQKRCDMQTRGRGVELRDIAFTRQDAQEDGWIMWALWDSGTEPLLKYAKVGVDASSGDESFASVKTTAEDLSKDDWRTVISERIFRPLQGEEFDATLEATREVVDASDIFLDRVSEPGRFSEGTLRLGLSTYREAAPSDIQTPDPDSFLSIKDEIAMVVASNCELESDPKTGGPMYEKLYASRVREWMRFVGLAEQIETAARWPIGLALTPLINSIKTASVPLLITRDGIAMPVVEDEASIIERMQRKSTQIVVGNRLVVTSKPSELSSSERDLLIRAADAHPTNILPLLGDTSATVAEVLTLLESASDLASRFTTPELEAFDSRLQEFLSRPITVSMKEALADLWNEHLAVIAGEEAMELTQRIVSDMGTSLDGALKDVLVLLSTNANLGGAATLDLPIASTDLGSALTADALIQTISSRHRLAVIFTLLMSALAAHDRMVELVANDGVQIAAALTVFQELSAALQLARTEGRVQITSHISDMAETDSIVAKLNRMSVEGRKSREPRHFAAPTLLHQCIREQLLVTSCDLLTETEADEEGSPLSIQVKRAVMSSLWSLGLTDARQCLMSEAPPLLPVLNDRHTSFAFAILTKGYPESAEALLSSFPENPASLYVRARALVQMLRLEEAGACFEKVSNALLLSSNVGNKPRDALFQLLPTVVIQAQDEQRLAEYFRHVASFFEPLEAAEYIIKFCQASIDAVGTYATRQSSPNAETGAADEAEGIKASGPKEIWFKIFRCQLALNDFEGAYSTIMATPYEGVRKDCLRNLVSIMCEEGHIEPLLSFTFPGLQREVERTLSFRARNSDPLSAPNYYSVLYSYHIFRGDLKSAGAVMYQHAERLSKLHRSGPYGSEGLDPLERFMTVAVEQAQSYLASINALTMLKHENAWFAHVADAEDKESDEADDRVSIFGSTGGGMPDKTSNNTSKHNSALTRYIPTSAYSRRVQEIRVVSVDDIRREYTLALARLELVKRYPDLAYSTTVLRPSDAVLLFVNSDSFDSAFSTAWSLAVDMTPIFSALTTKAVALSRYKADRDASKQRGNPKEPKATDMHPELLELQEGDEDLLEPEALFLSLSEKSASWEGPASTRAWRYIRYHLEMYDTDVTGKYHQVVLARASALDASVVPTWLTEWFSTHGNSDVLLRIWIQNGLIIEAAHFAASWLQSSTAKAATLQGSHEQFISYHAIDTILLNLEEESVAPSRRSEAKTAKTALQEASKRHVDALAARTKTLKRQAEQDAYRQEKRREQQTGPLGRPVGGTRF